MSQQRFVPSLSAFLCIFIGSGFPNGELMIQVLRDSQQLCLFRLKAAQRESMPSTLRWQTAMAGEAMEEKENILLLIC